MGERDYNMPKAKNTDAKSVTLKLKQSKIIDFKVYQLVNRKTGQRTKPTIMTGGPGGDELALISGLGLFNPSDVKDEYKDSYITQN